MKFMQKQKNYYRWLIWGVLCLTYIISVLHRMGMGVIRADLGDTFNMSAMAFAAVGSVYFYAYMVMQIPAGMLADSIGVRVTAAAGTALAGVGSVLFGLSPTVSLVYVARFLIALGVSVLFVSILKIQASWFHEREFGRLSGLAVLFENTGAILSQTPLVALVALLTWRYSFVLVGVAGMITAAICLLIIRNKPSDIGLPPPTNCETEKNKPKKQNVIRALSQVCKNPYTWPVGISYAGVNGSLMALTGTWGQSYFIDVYGMGEMKAASYNTIYPYWRSDCRLVRRLGIRQTAKKKSPDDYFGYSLHTLLDCSGACLRREAAVIYFKGAYFYNGLVL